MMLRPGRSWIPALMLLLLLLSVVGTAPATAQETDRVPASELASEPASGDAMVVATREAPPFAFKGEDGEWRGLAIQLWEEIAAERDLDFRYAEADLADMTAGVADGRYGASVGALTITPDREQTVDFSHPFFATGFGIAARKAPSSWVSLFRNFFTWGFLQAVLLLAAVLAIVGLLFWLVERRHNEDEFGGSTVKGIGSGFWFSAVTMTTVGYGDKAPRTTAGRILALIWMFAAIIIISTFTGLIASSLTADRIAGTVAGPDDLPSVSVGSVPGSASEEWLAADGVGFEGYESVADGLAAVKSGDIDAFVYDRPLLAYGVGEGFSDELQVVPGSFGRQDYGIALPEGSDLREPVNLSLLHYIEGAEWRRAVAISTGERD